MVQSYIVTALVQSVGEYGMLNVFPWFVFVVFEVVYRQMRFWISPVCFHFEFEFLLHFMTDVDTAVVQW